jgi:hypothetical protein
MRRPLLVIAFTLVLAGGCSRRDDRGRVIVRGLDGMEPSVVDQLIDEGARCRTSSGCATAELRVCSAAASRS